MQPGGVSPGSAGRKGNRVPQGTVEAQRSTVNREGTAQQANREGHDFQSLACLEPPRAQRGRRDLRTKRLRNKGDSMRKDIVRVS